ncbi:hypothetical protein ACJMK2_034164 [Sinanodonta woodiana]|uniref:Cytosolic endo-beta-N-acetylglucosaminidase n=1 Tax=Sinanodonta woodiana TaxID=1069815 RepID=A0ABD3WS18_SINWO
MTSRCFDDKSGEPVCLPLKSLAEVQTWLPNQDDICVARIPRSQKVKQEQRPRTLVCHDMAGGYLEDRFIQGCFKDNCYRFYHWNYIDTFVYFSHYFVTIPPPGWTNAAHKHGVCILGTVITEWDDGKKNCEIFLQTEESYKALANKLVQIAVYYQFDGWLINIENIIQVNMIENLAGFVQYLTQKMHEAVPESLVIWYDSVISSGELKWQDQLNEKNRMFFDACDGIFLNYCWNEEKLLNSKIFASAASRSYDVYVGIDVFGRGCLGGGGYNTIKALTLVRNFSLSAAIFAQGWVYETQGMEKFTENENRFWSYLGPHCHCRPIKSLPLVTSFCQGYGQKYYLHGKAFSDSPWSNLSIQNMQPILTTVSQCDDQIQIEGQTISEGNPTDNVLTISKGNLTDNVLTLSEWNPTDSVLTISEGNPTDSVQTISEGNLTDSVQTISEGNPTDSVLIISEGNPTDSVLTISERNPTDSVLTFSEGNLTDSVLTISEGNLTNSVLTISEGNLTDNVQIKNDGTTPTSSESTRTKMQMAGVVETYIYAEDAYIGGTCLKLKADLRNKKSATSGLFNCDVTITCHTSLLVTYTYKDTEAEDCDLFIELQTETHGQCQIFLLASSTIDDGQMEVVRVKDGTKLQVKENKKILVSPISLAEATQHFKLIKDDAKIGILNGWMTRYFWLSEEELNECRIKEIRVGLFSLDGEEHKSRDRTVSKLLGQIQILSSDVFSSGIPKINDVNASFEKQLETDIVLTSLKVSQEKVKADIQSGSITIHWSGDEENLVDYYNIYHITGDQEDNLHEKLIGQTLHKCFRVSCFDRIEDKTQENNDNSSEPKEPMKFLIQPVLKFGNCLAMESCTFIFFPNQNIS